MRRRRLWRWILGIVISLVILLVIAAWPGSSTFTISPETTYVTEPVDKDGYIDYVTALNQRLSQGVSPEKNANVLIWQAIGPPEYMEMPAEYFQWLGIEPPPEKGQYWIDWREYILGQDEIDPRFETEQAIEQAINLPYEPEKAKNNPELAKWLERNGKALALAVEATRRPCYFNPQVPGRLDDRPLGLHDIPDVSESNCRRIAHALIWRAMLSTAHGRTDAAWQDLLAVHRLGRLIGRGASVAEFFIARAIENMAAMGDLAFLGHAKLTPKQIKSCLKDLAGLPPMPALADQIDTGERFGLLETILFIARYGPESISPLHRGENAESSRVQSRRRLFTRSINWDPALRSVNKWIDRIVKALAIEDRKARGLALSAVDREVSSARQQVEANGLLEKLCMGASRRGEYIGCYTIELWLLSLNRFLHSANRTEQVGRNLRVAFALAAYHSENGHYPAILEELTPKYLDKVPNDLFSDSPLIYRRQGDGYLLYSVGDNGKDDDGAGYDDVPPGDDIVVRMPPTAAKHD